MTRRPLRNVAASVRTRLLNRARAKGEDFQFLLQRYAAERFLHRLGESDYRSRLILKGAMLLALWGNSRSTPERLVLRAGVPCAGRRSRVGSLSS